MEILTSVFQAWWPALLTIIVFAFMYKLASRILDRQAKGKADKGLIKSIVLFTILFIAVIAFIISLPMDSEAKGQITNLIGIVLSAVIGLSATTFIGNGIAGLALRMRGNFRPGDFIEVLDTFGRVTELGLFHTEVQTEDRNLTTLPNMSLISNPMKVTRSSGTFISAEVGLGYDVHRKKIEDALILAAKNAGLEDPYVLITTIGDFTVGYKVHGLLKKVESLITARSRLTGSVIDALHEAKIEIVSPGFVNQRQVNETVFIPKKMVVKETEEEVNADKIIFDKAEEAEGIEKRKKLLADVEEKIKKEEEELSVVKDTVAKEKLKEKLESTKKLKEKIVDRIDQKLDDLEQSD